MSGFREPKPGIRLAQDGERFDFFPTTKVQVEGTHTAREGNISIVVLNHTIQGSTEILQELQATGLVWQFREKDEFVSSHPASKPSPLDQRRDAFSYRNQNSIA